MRFFKRNEFRHKIRFSQAQHAISDLVMRLFKIFSPQPLLNFYKKWNVLRELRTPQGFWHYANYRRPSKTFSENFLNFLFFKGFSLRKRWVICCFQLGKNDFRDLCVSFRVFFGAVYCKIDEILMSFYECGRFRPTSNFDRFRPIFNRFRPTQISSHFRQISSHFWQISSHFWQILSRITNSMGNYSMLYTKLSAYRYNLSGDSSFGAVTANMYGTWFFWRN